MYSADQVRHPYVVKRKVTSLGDTPQAGDLAITVSTVGQPYPKIAVMEYQSGNGESTRSDIIELKNIEYINAKAGYSRKLKRLELDLDSNVNAGAVKVGADYMFRITLYGLGIGGGEVSISRMIGPYTAETSDTKADVFSALLDSFNDNFKKEHMKYVVAKVTGSGNSAKLVIEEAPVVFKLGKTSGNPLNFAVVTTPVEDLNDEAWGSVTDTTTTNNNVVPNGVKVADMEHFYMGERMANVHQWNSPYSFTPLADPTKTYETVDICYFYKGNNEDIQHSRKMISLFLDADSGITGAQIIALLAPSSASTVIDSLAVDSSTLALPKAAGTGNIQVTADAPWTATVAAGATSWLSIAPASGDDDVTMVVTVTANSAAARNGDITLTNGLITKTVTVTQASGA